MSSLKDMIKQKEENCKQAGNMVSAGVCKRIGEDVQEAVLNLKEYVKDFHNLSTKERAMLLAIRNKIDKEFGDWEGQEK